MTISPIGLRLSLALGILALALDRAHKYYQVEVLQWPIGLFHPITPFFDLGLVFNPGISYGLLGTVPIWGIAAIVIVALLALTIWWLRTDSRLVRFGLALCIGGALSNALDRVIYGAVADFFWLHFGDLSLFVFNLADAAITLGVLLLVLDFLGIGRARATNPA